MQSQEQAISDKTLLYIHRNKPRLLLGPAAPVDPAPSGARAEITERDDGAIKRNEQLIWEKFNKNDYLASELYSQFGGQAKDLVVKNYAWPTYEEEEEEPIASNHAPKLIDKLLANRTKEYTRRREENTLQIRGLADERQKLLDERYLVKEQRRQMAVQSPAFSNTGSLQSDPGAAFSGLERFIPSRADSVRSVHGVDSYIRRTNTQLPAQIAKYHRLRQQFHDDYERLHKPYRGELGPQSYDSWQLDDYSMVRSVVEEMIDKFLDAHFRDELRPSINREAAEAMLEADRRELERRRNAVSESRAIQLIMEELVLEETSEMCREIAVVFSHLVKYFVNKTNSHLMNIAEVVANEVVRPEEDAVYPLVTKTYLGQQFDRNRYRRGIWTHSQHLHLRGRIQDDDDDGDNEDVLVLHCHDITPLDLRQLDAIAKDTYAQKVAKESYKRYRDKDVEYWHMMSANVTVMGFASKCQGILTAKPSPNHRLMAFATVHGDIIVYDLHWSPFRPIRAVHNQAKPDVAVVQLTWSLDSTRLVTINQMGVLTVWSLNARGAVKADLKALELKADSTGVNVEELSQQVMLSPDREEFRFKAGPMADLDAISQNFGPTLTAFYPSFTFFGTQPSLCVALDNGDILKCFLDDKLIGQVEYPAPPPQTPDQTADQTDPGAPPPQPPGGSTDILTESAPLINVSSPEVQLSVIGQGIAAELFRCHKYPLLLMDFALGTEAMVTVDQKGFINLWQYDSNHYDSMGWVQPHLRAKLDMSKTMYSPTSNARPSIVFTDRIKAGSRQTKTRQQIAAERQKAESLVAELDLGDPWHEDRIQDQGLVSRIYPPNDPVPQSGSVFHVIIRHTNSAMLSTYLTRVYKPVKVKSTRLVACKMTPGGKEIVFLLLFPEFPPKEAHLMVLIVDVLTMQLRDFRLDIIVEDDQLYQDCLQQDVVSCAVSPPVGMTGTTYLLVNLKGRLSMYSLLTGAQTLRMEDKKSPLGDGFQGCRLNLRAVSIPATAHLAITSTNDKLYLFMYTADKREKKLLNQVSVIDLVDDNPQEMRRTLRTSWQMWKDKPAAPPVEQSMQKDVKPINLRQHPQAFTRKLLMQVIDSVVQKKEGRYSKDEADEMSAMDRVRTYQEAIAQLPKVTLPAPLSLPEETPFSVAPSRSGSRPGSMARTASQPAVSARSTPNSRPDSRLSAQQATNAQ